MSALSLDMIDEILEKGSISDFEIARMRRHYYRDGVISQTEAEKLFTANDRCETKDASWAGFFIDVVADFIINQTEPEGYLTGANADWLMGQIASEGKSADNVELELLITVLDRARWSPVRLIRFALEQVKRAVLDNSGPLRSGCNLEACIIGEAEVDILRRMLYAFGGDGNIAVTRAEAEVLFEIDDATADAPPSPAWTALFTKAIANAVMAASGYAVPTRDAALRAEQWLENRGDIGPVSLFSKTVSSSLSSIIESYREQSPEERALARLERQRVEIVTNEAVTMAEAEWLAEQIGRDGVLSVNEEALIAFLNSESPKIHPLLAQRVAQLSAAA